MKLWSTTTVHKYFVKMLWHLLSECVKTTVLLVCSICTVHRFFFFFFFQVIDWCSFFYRIFALFKQRFSLFIYSSILVSHFFFFLNSSYSTKWHSSYIFFFESSVCTFFLLYILLYWYNKFYNIFTIIEVSISYKSK